MRPSNHQQLLLKGITPILLYKNLLNNSRKVKNTSNSKDQQFKTNKCEAKVHLSLLYDNIHAEFIEF